MAVAVSAKAGGVPHLEAACRGGEVCAELGIEGGELVVELEDLVVEPPFVLADMEFPLGALERVAAVGAGHEAGKKHESGIGKRRSRLERFRARDRVRFVMSEAKT